MYKLNKPTQLVLCELKADIFIHPLIELATSSDSAPPSSAELKRELQALLQHRPDGALVAAQLALHSRRDLDRQVAPIKVAVELLSTLRSSGMIFEHARCFIMMLIEKVDHLTDMYSYALSVFGEKGKVPLSLKRGVGDAFNKFDAQQFAKHKPNKRLTLQTLLRTVHPHPTSAFQSLLFERIMQGTLGAYDSTRSAS